MDCWEMSKLFEIRNWVNDIEKYVEKGDKKDLKYVVYGVCEVREIVNEVVNVNNDREVWDE